MSKSTAWILDFESGFQAAVGELEMVHLMQFPILLEIPQSPFYCRHVLIWHENLLPAMNLGALLQQGYATHHQQPLAGIFAYQQCSGNDDTAYGALLLTAIPKRLQVSDEHACAIPREPSGWQQWAISCFKHDNKTVPILNLTRVFGSTVAS